MPLKLNVGLSRKVGEANFGSRGANINVEMEADAGLIGEPDKLKDRLRQLFTLVRTSLNEELCGHSAHTPEQTTTLAINGHHNGHPTDSVPAIGSNGAAFNRLDSQPAPASITPPRPATPLQIKALYGIAYGQGLDLNHYLSEHYAVGHPSALTIKQASRLIDQLKASSANR